MKKLKLILAFFLMPIVIYASEISPKLSKQLQDAKGDQEVSCIVLMKTIDNAPKISPSQNASAQSRILTFKSIAQQSQASLNSWLTGKSTQVKRVHSYWVINGIHVVATPAIIREIGLREDVEAIYSDDTAHVDAVPATSNSKISGAVEWNITKVQADKCWTDGYTGEGVIIGFIDSGVDYLHPALAGKWSGHWFVADGLPKTDKPYDDFGHGTHVAGIVLGGDGPGPIADDIGMAPGAKYVAAKGLNKGGSGKSSQLIQAIEYMAGLKATLNIVAVSCSWNNNNGGDQVYWDAFKALRSLGVLVIISNGNKGETGAGSVQSPADYPFVVGVGATDNADKIAGLSSLGPTTQNPPYNDKSLWIRSDWNYIKPNLSAPGITIRSSVPGGKFSGKNGTSMAAPHVLGAIALISQKNRNLTTDSMYNILMNNLDKPDPSVTYPNNSYGWGRLNAYKMLQATSTMNRPWVDLLSSSMNALTAGQRAGLVLSIKNQGAVNAMNTVIQVVSNDNYIEVQDASFSFGNLNPLQVASNSAKAFKIIAHPLTPPGHAASVSMIIHADGPQDNLDFQDTLIFEFSIGLAPQPVVIWEEDFEYGGDADSFATYWDKTGNWVRTAAQSNSPTHSVFSGVWNTTNSLTLKNNIDLSNYTDLRLSYWDKSNLGKPENWYILKTEASSNGGTSWTTVFENGGSAEGSGTTKPWSATNDIPLATFNKGTVKIRFSLSKQAVNQEPSEWYLDNIRIYTPTDNAPPYFSNTTIWKDGAARGPFKVQSNITDKNGVKSTVLNYRIGTGAWTPIPLTLVSGNLYAADIPVQTGTGKISYYLEAVDNWIRNPQNAGAFPVGANQSAGFISFTYGGTGILLPQSKADFAFQSVKSQSGVLDIKFTLPENMRVNVALVDWSGRNIKTIMNQTAVSGQHSLSFGKARGETLAPGIYFVSFQATPTQAGKSSTKIEKVERFMVMD